MGNRENHGAGGLTMRMHPRGQLIGLGILIVDIAALFHE